MTTATSGDATGVDYGTLDQFKRECQVAARHTNGFANRLAVTTVGWTRGESAMLFSIGENVTQIGLVHEGLGTKNLVADAWGKITGDWSKYGNIARDTLAMAFNDAATVGVIPAVTTQHLSVGSAEWFKNRARYQALIEGWVEGCREGRCVWGPGETPELKDVLLPTAAELSSAVIGVQCGNIDPRRIEPRLDIVGIQGTGIHANGLSFCRRLAAQLPEGYLAEVVPGLRFGEALLEATPLYSAIVDDLLEAGVDIRYAVNVTGHGWRKLMRAESRIGYVITELPDAMPIFRFLQEKGGVDDRAAYSSWNMNLGYALLVRGGAGKEVCRRINGEHPYRAFVAGHTEERVEKCVEIAPLGITYKAHELEVR